ATSHDDLEQALEPDIIARCDFGRIELWKRNQRGEYETVTAVDNDAAVERRERSADQFRAKRARSHGRSGGRSADARTESHRRGAQQRVGGAADSPGDRTPGNPGAKRAKGAGGSADHRATACACGPAGSSRV